MKITDAESGDLYILFYEMAVSYMPTTNCRCIGA